MKGPVMKQSDAAWFSGPRHSILSWRTLAHGACALASGHTGINSAPRLPQAALLKHGIRRLPWARTFTVLHYLIQGSPLPREPRRSGSGGLHAEVGSTPRLAATATRWSPLPSSSSPSSNLSHFTVFTASLFSSGSASFASRQHVEAIKEGDGERNVRAES